jgi:hypothetical protein
MARDLTASASGVIGVPIERIRPHFLNRALFRTRGKRRALRFRPVLRVARPREHRPRAHRSRSSPRRGPPRGDAEPSDLDVVPLERFRADVDAWLRGAA